jgi:hypothetical protein
VSRKPKISPYETAEFKALKKYWDAKLIASGHREIENFDLPEAKLINWDNHIFRRLTPKQFEQRRRYYEQASKLLNSDVFATPLHKEVWRLHSEGIDVRGIAERLGPDSIKKSTVATILRHYKKELA